MIDALRGGTWLTAERIRAMPRMLLAVTTLAILVWIGLSDGLIDPNGKPLGTDFSNVYAAGELANRGEAAAAYDPGRQHAAEKEVFGGREVPFYGWHYPPMFLAVAALLALLPYGWALLAWMVATMPAYLAVVRAILPRPEAIVSALAFPAAFVNLGHGQNGFLTAALLGGALVLLDRKPVVAGILIGLLAYKPQFGILIPVVLAASGRWTVFLSATVCVALSALATLAVFGPEIWLAFAESSAFTRTVVLEAGGTGWAKIQSLFSALRLWGASPSMAYVAQAALAAFILASLLWLWRGHAAGELKAAALAAGSLLATPYVLDYDMVVLGVAIAFFAAHGLKHGFRDWEASALALAWVSPLIARSVMGATGMPVGFLAMLSLYALIVRRAALDSVAATHLQQRSESLAKA